MKNAPAAAPLACLALVLLAGCSGAPDATSDEAAGASASTAGETVLSFDADDTEHASGALVPGAKARIRYAFAREKCHDAFGNSATTVFFRADGGHATSVHLIRSPHDGSLGAEITVPHGHTLDVWFHAQTFEGEENSGCDAWDSNFGQNFGFHIQ